MPDVELVDVAAPRGPDEGDELVVLEPHLVESVEVEVGGLGLDPGADFTFGLVERVVRGDQVAVDRVAEVGQIEPAESAVPVGAVALASIELLSGDLQEIGIRAGAW